MMIEKKKRKVEKGAKELPKKTAKNVEFIFHAPEAMEVFLAGEFNSWDTGSLLMKKNKEGVWKTSVKLAPGRYEYKLFVDGVWVENIPGAEPVPNPFGTQNWVVWVK
jgi:1,4-alpha-glucan branching enzyme